MSHRSRFASELRTNAPLRVPTNTRTLLIPCSFPIRAPVFMGSFFRTSAIGPPVEVALLYGRAARLEIDRPGKKKSQAPLSILGSAALLPTVVRPGREGAIKHLCLVHNKIKKLDALSKSEFGVFRKAGEPKSAVLIGSHDRAVIACSQRLVLPDPIGEECGTMAQPILSTNPLWAKDGWHKMPAVPGVVYANFLVAPPPHNWVWGKRHMIEFLIRLAQDWMFAFYDSQMKEFGNTAPIILGDISPEGGVGPNGSVKVTQAQLNQRIRVRGHSSHKRGVDVDIYAVRKDGQPRHVHADTNDYDLVRTTALAQCILIAGRGKIERIFFDDTRVTSQLKPLPPGLLQFGPDQLGMHKDHFHIRLNEY